MKRSSLIFLLTVLYSVSGGAFCLWSGGLWVASRPTSARANEVLGASTSSDSTSLLPYPVVKSDSKKPLINARQYVLYDTTSGKILVDKDAEKRVPIASTTKLMTSLIVVKMGGLDSLATVSQTAGTVTGSLMGVKPGQQFVVKDLLYGMLLVSGNDAAHTLAETYGRRLLNDPNATAEASTARFVQEMNDEASHLGMTDTHYNSPDGLDDTGYSSALDLAKLTSVDNQQEVIHEITTTATIDVHTADGKTTFSLRNSDHLLTDSNYPGLYSGKTGSTPAAGHCLVVSATQNNETLVAVILSTYLETITASADEAGKLLNWGFANTTLQ